MRNEEMADLAFIPAIPAMLNSFLFTNQTLVQIYLFRGSASSGMEGKMKRNLQPQTANRF